MVKAGDKPYRSQDTPDKQTGRYTGSSRFNFDSDFAPDLHSGSAFDSILIDYLFYQQHQGSLFTLFLHSPLTAFCYCCNISNIPVSMWDKSQSHIDRFMAEASKSITRSRVDPTYIQFLGDDFLRLLILRFVFCDMVLHLHRSFDSRTHRPKASPPLPEAEVLDNITLVHIIYDLAILLDARSYFSDSHVVRRRQACAGQGVMTRDTSFAQNEDAKYNRSDLPCNYYLRNVHLVSGM
ncbi:Protein SCAI [Eumeta japonica]|uniref:Protein SCAI n=1 Tax=Eumeta variegata TaxID=151549 RepID=A0A4C1S8Y2_EUMVA|nr:Protein SCAI [Eumeta japonica]